jgi:hypothetical protein
MAKKKEESPEDFLEGGDDLFDDADTPSGEIGSSEQMATIDDITDQWEEDNKEPQGDIVPPSIASTTVTGGQLEAIIGPNAFADLDTIFQNRGQSVSSQVDIQSIPNIGHIEVQNDKGDNATYLIFYDTEGNNITSEVTTEMGISTTDNITQIIGETGLKFGQILQKSPLSSRVEGSNKWSPSTMGNALAPHFENFISNFAATQRRGQLSDQLQHLRSLMLSLQSVFAFDDYRHLEAFMAAWMMKDSTCRLSGVPGTGKTTVIECAATLLSNSYGFNSIPRVCAAKDYKLSADEHNKVFTSNLSKDNIYTPTVFPTGQQYNIIYGNISRPEIKDLWEDWRFSRWTEPKKVGANHMYVGADASKRSYVLPSGAYLYDFRYLQPIHNDGRQKVALQMEAFRNLLFQHYYVDVPYNFEVTDSTTWPQVKNGIPQIPEGVAKKRIVKPVKIMDENGAVDFAQILTIKETIGEGDDAKEAELSMQLANPDMTKERISKLLVEITDITNQNATDIISGYMEESGLDGLYTDTGRNEGYWLREFLHETCYDSRANPESPNYGSISQEMIAEIGIAKIDYEKRADEVLYGMEIRETQAFDPAKGAQVSTFDFEPTPRPVVTQPVKFFNEANRSKAGMEDAILGLIAERKVEYRGKEFDSPNFVAWMDTNPHQKGNDLAFTDRIDMELLFKSVSLGGRYNILSGKGGGKPVIALVERMTHTDAVKPLRFANLRAMWDYILDDDSGIQMMQPGGAYDGYRDIASISVLFSQSYRTRNTTLPVGENTVAPWLVNPHESPLIDFSTTTNTTAAAAGGGTDSPVLTKGKEAFANNNESANNWANGSLAQEMQLPSIFTRVLGFRFTNSLAKLSRAFAFLRGKSYVSREDIVDAVPYVCAHRIGRSREGVTDTEGNTKGIPAKLANDFAYNNEQEFLRDVLVDGYLNRNIDVGQGQGASLLEMLDSFYERCVSVLQSNDYAHTYESEVLNALQRVFSETFGSDGNLGRNLTPVHWHIATMVSESERNGQTILRNYTVPEANKNGYPEMYAYYLQKITAPVSNTELRGESCLYDVMKIRVEILNNPNLFSDDKVRLMALADEEIAIMASTATNMGRANDIGPINNRAYDNTLLTGIGGTGWNPILPLLSYGDTLGGWATVTGTKPPQQEVRNVQSGLNMTSQMFGSESGHRGISGQQLKLIGRIQEGSRSGDSQEYGRFMVNLSRFLGIIGPMVVGNGRLILTPSNMEGNYPIDFTTFMDIVKSQVKDWSQPMGDAPPSFLFTDNSGQEQSYSVDFRGTEGYTGISACFSIPHAPTSNLDMGTITTETRSEVGQIRETTTPIRSNPYDANLWRDTDNDFLRLWINICALGEPETADSGIFQTYVFSASVTSNLATYEGEPDGGAVSEEAQQTAGTVSLLPIDNRACYSTNTYGGNNTVQDSGNITKGDREYYLGMIGDALQPRQS